jgi:hypothetical protein
MSPFTVANCLITGKKPSIAPDDGEGHRRTFLQLDEVTDALRQYHRFPSCRIPDATVAVIRL